VLPLWKARPHKDGAIAGIAILEHRKDRGRPAEKVADDIVDQQIIDVDAISGATNSSTVIKKAVENALVPQRDG
jgi:uncharacterized protein with FMN-binding domain